MPSPEQIAAAGPWPIVVFFLASGIVGLWIAFQKRWIVPGWLYDREREDNRVLRDQTDRNTKALEALVAAEKRRDRVRKGP